MIVNAKKAEFQGQLKNSSLRFNLDTKNNKLTYNNNISGGVGDPKELVYNTNASALIKKTSWAE